MASAHEDFTHKFVPCLSQIESEYRDFISKDTYTFLVSLCVGNMSMVQS